MASKLNEFFARFGKSGGTKGLGAGMGGLLAAAGLLYAGTQSVFTGLI